jgi:hypothetical protein
MQNEQPSAMILLTTVDSKHTVADVGIALLYACQNDGAFLDYINSFDKKLHSFRSATASPPKPFFLAPTFCWTPWPTLME